MSKTKLKVGILWLGLNKDGGTRVMSSLANHLAQNHEVHLWAQVKEEYPFNLSSQIHLHVKDMSSQQGVGKLKSLLLLFRHLMSQRAVLKDLDVIISSYYLTAPMAIFFKPQKGLSILLMQSWEPGRLNGTFRGWMASLAHRLPFDRIVCVSTWLKGLLPSEIQERVTVINPGIGDHFFASAKERSWERPKHEYRIGTVASMSPNKRFDIFLEMANAPKLISGDNFTFCAATPQAFEKGMVPTHVESCPINSDEDLTTFYRHIDILVFTSEVEGYSLVPLEAMSQGTPCIVTSCGGINDYAVARKNALFVRDWSAEAFCDEILKLTADPTLYAQLSRCSLETATENRLNEFCLVFEKLLITSRNDCHV